MVGVISGKFRLLHNGHVEYILNSTNEKIDKLYVIICENPNSQRYASITDTSIAISKILSDIDIDFKILVYNYQYEDTNVISDEFEEFVINTITSMESCKLEDIIIYNGKDDYINTRLRSKRLSISQTHLSSTDIEKNPYANEVYVNIAKEYMPYINKKIVISGVESTGKTQTSIKLAKTFNTSYSVEVGRWYAKQYLGNNDNLFLPKDFVHIAMEQTLQDKQVNYEAKRFLICDTDPFVTLRFLRSYKDFYYQLMNEGMLSVNEIAEFENEYSEAEQSLMIICKKYEADLTILLAPTVDYVKDGIRWDNQTQEERIRRHQELIQLYDEFNVNYVIIKDDNFVSRFSAVVKHVENCLKELVK